jgi:hypothetical protein|tara:strand:+ start:521 stop:1099 length:579 start_codon:yes stop_codon:yes gene_type:complete
MAYVLFISEDKLKDSTSIYGSVDSSLLLPYVRQAQRLYVETKLGTKLTQKLKDLIIAGTINNVGNEYYKELLNDYIGDYLPNMALYMAFPFLRFKIEAGNIYSKTSETGVALSTEEAQHLRSEILNTGEYFIERMIDFIKNNISRFPEYNTNTGSDVSPDSNGYSYQGMNLDRPNAKGNKITLNDFLTPDLT